MNKRIYFNAFHMNCVVHQSPGLWVRSDDQMVNYTDLDSWVELAKLLERGRFDALFLAARNDVDVQMRHALAHPVVDRHERAFRLHSMLYSARQQPRVTE